TTPLPELRPDFPFVIDFARSLYFHPEGDGLLTGMSNPNQPPGFDETVSDEWEFTHLDAAIERLPLLENAGLLSHWAGLYEVTPDAHPIIDAIAARPGYFVVTGFSGHGFMHGPIAGQLMTEIILDGQAATVDISSLAYNRFSAEQLNREYNVI
ncbi:MAG: FAD-binding oxidoreductase, partial [Chloroflexi bacterium]